MRTSDNARKRLTNIDTLTEKLELAFRKGRKWKSVVVDKRP